MGAFYPRLVGLTGSEAQAAAAARAYRVHRARVVLPVAAPGGYPATDGSIAYRMGPAGEFVTLFPHDAEAEAIAETMWSREKYCISEGVELPDAACPNSMNT